MAERLNAGPERARSLADRLTAIGVTTSGLLFLIWAAFQLLDNPWAVEEVRTGFDPAAHEQRAYERLAEIARAQQRFRQIDWDQDGRHVYALFLPHLWLLPGPEPISVGLLEQDLAFAIAASRAVDGYWYENVHGIARPPAEVEELGLGRFLDPTTEWAVAAHPANPPASGRLSLFVSTDQRIWAHRRISGRFDMIPRDPPAEGWIEVHGPAELARAVLAEP